MAVRALLDPTGAERRVPGGERHAAAVEGERKEPAWQKWLHDEPRIKPFVDMLAYGRSTPKITAWQQVTDILAAARDDAGAQKKTPKEALDDAVRTALPLIQQG